MGVGDLPHQARLAHAGLPDQGHELAMPSGGAAERLAELLDLGLTTDEAGEPASGGRLKPGPHEGLRRPSRRRRRALSSPFTGTGPRGFTSM